MSWNPFKRAFSSRRGKQEDQSFEHEVQRLRHMQGVCKRLYKEMRKCSEAELAQVKIDNKIAFELRASPSSKTEPLKSSVEALVACSDELQTHTREHYSVVDVTFYDPMKRFRDVYKHLDFHFKQREARLQDVERQQVKLDKRRASSSVSATKLELTQRKLASRKADYERVHDRLMHDLPKLYDGRVDFFEPCLVAMVQSQFLYHQNCTKALESTLSALEKNKELHQQQDRTVEECFEDIRKLSIVGETT